MFIYIHDVKGTKLKSVSESLAELIYCLRSQQFKRRTLGEIAHIPWSTDVTAISEINEPHRIANSKPQTFNTH